MVGAVAASSYLLLIGGTWRGVTEATTARVSLVLFALLVGVWLWLRRSATWHQTAFDPVLPLWGIAFAVSSMANVGMRGQIASGLWFVGLYIVVWYILQDLLANRILERAVLLSLLLVAGVPVLASALIEAVRIYPACIGGALENPNNLGGWLLLIIPLLLERWINRRGLERWLLSAYLLAAGAVLLLTDSRGAMLGLLTAFLFVVFRSFKRIELRVASALIYVVSVLLLIGIRGDSGRLPIYGDLISENWDHILTGTGLFTVRLDYHTGLIPGGTSLYAHNLLLHVAVELGIVGLIALAVSLLIFWRLRLAPGDSSRLWAYAAVTGALAQQMVDFPLMMPALALAGIVVLSVAVPTGKPMQGRYGVWAVELVAVGLIAAGLLRAPLRIY